MLEGLRARIRRGYRDAHSRETGFLMSFKVSSLNSKLMVLLSVFVFLNFLDAATTLIALRSGPGFLELNPIASGLFQLSLPGFGLALALKYLPILPLAYATFLPEATDRPVATRVVKLGTLVALAAANIFYGLVDASNVATLLRFYLP